MDDMSPLSRCPRCGTELVRIGEPKWFALFGCPHCGAICIFPPQDDGKKEAEGPKYVRWEPGNGTSYKALAFPIKEADG